MRIEVQHAAIDRHRERGLAQFGQPYLSQAQAELHLLLGLRSQGELTVENLGQLSPVFLSLVETVERNDRFEVALIVGKDLVVGGDRTFVLLEQLLLEVRDLKAKLLTRFGLGLEGNLTPIDLQQLSPVLVSLVECLQSVERLKVVRIDVGRTLVASDRLCGVLPDAGRRPRPTCRGGCASGCWRMSLFVASS